MYDFIDVTEQQNSIPLPTEAVQFNGQSLDLLIPGFRTLYVTGREIAEVEISEYEVGVTDGSRFKGKRYPARTITVGYQLIAKNAAEFRKSFNELNRILNQEEGKIVFNDEPGWYFLGTKTGGSLPDPGKNSIKAEIDFYCANPFKYAKEETEVLPTTDNNDTFVINYGGTYKAYPVIETTMLSDNGCVCFVDANGNILQFGNVDEVDGENYEKSETLINDSFTSSVTGWRLNEATTVKVSSEHRQDGSVGMDMAGLYASSYGTGGNWHGPGYAKTVPADSKGHSGAKNCTLSWHHRFAITGHNGMGVAQFHMTDSNKKNVAAVTYFKNEYDGTNRARVHLYVNGIMRKEIVYTCEETNKISGSSAGRSSISKFGSTFEFNIAGQITSFEFPEMKDVEVTEISTFIGKWGTSNPIDQNSVYSMKFVSHSVPDWRDVPNKFGVGDVLLIDCASGSVKLNGVETPGLGALGNQWEKFYLSPGLNQIRCVYSSFATHPDFRLRHREVKI